MLPDFFVIGAQKAGSTYLLQCLGEHPQIYMPPDEVAFFEDSLIQRSVSVISSGTLLLLNLVRWSA